MSRRLACLPLLALACAAPTAPATRAPRVGDDLVARRLALGPTDDVLRIRGDERQRLRALRDLAAELGNDAEAMSAAWDVLELSRQRVAVTTADGEDVAAARRAVVADAVALVDLAVATGRHDDIRRLADTGVAIDPTFPRAAAFLTATQRARGWLSDEQRTAALRIARTDRDRALLERAGVPPALDLAQVVALGGDFADRIEARMARAITAGDRAAAVAAARALLAVEPLHVDARLVVAYERDRAAGRLVDDAEVLRALTAAPVRGEHVPGPQTVAIIEHARTAAPAATSLGVGSAWVLLNAGLGGDAAARLDAVNPGADQALHGDLRGLVALAAGDLSAYRTWRAARGGLASRFVADLELRYLGSSGALAQAEVAREAARRLGERGWFPLRRTAMATVAWALVTDDRAPAAVRERMIEVAGLPAPTRTVIRHCIARALARKACEALRDAADLLTEEVDEVTAEVTLVAAVPGAEGLWLPALLAVHPGELGAMAPHVRALEGTAPALTETWVRVAVQTALAVGDPGEARRLLDAYGALLAPLGQSGARLAIADVMADPARAEAAAMAFGTLGGEGWPHPQPPPAAATDRRASGPEDEDDDAEDEATEDGGATDDGEAAKLAAVVQHLWSRQLDEAHVQLEALRRAHPAEAATLAVTSALVAAGRGAAVDLAAFPDGVPERALLATTRDGRPDRAALAGYLTTRVDRGWPRAAYLAALLADRAPIAVEHVLPVPAHGRAMQAAAGADPWELAAAHGRGELVATHRQRRAERALTDAPDAGIRAAAAAALAAAPDDTRDPASIAWLALLAGDAARVRTVAAPPDADAPVLDASHPVLRLVADRAAVPDALVRDLWRYHQRHDGDRAALAARLLEIDRAGPGALACRLLVDADRADHALAPCWRAWRGGAVDADMAMALTWLVQTRRDEAATAGIDGAALATEIEHRLAASDEPGLWLNLSNWYLLVDDAARAREHADRAERLGRDTSDIAVGLLDMADPRHLALRAIPAHHGADDRELAVELARLAFAAGELGAARWYAAVSLGRQPRETTTADATAENELAAEMIADLTEIAAADVAAGALTVADTATWYRVFAADEAHAPAFVAAHPASVLLAVEGRTPIPGTVDPVLVDGLRRMPENRALIAETAARYTAAGRHADAAALVARGRALYPGSRVLDLAVASGGSAAAAWLADGDHFAAALAAVTPAELAAVAPVREVVGAAEVFLPRAKVGGAGQFNLASGGRIVVAEHANPSRCQGVACVDALLGGLDASWQRRWTRPATVGGRAGGQLLVDAPFGTLLITLVPSGGRVFQVVALIPAATADAMRPALRLVHDSLRPLDLVAPADRAEAVRAATALPPDEVRWAARAGVAAAGCGWLPALAPEARHALAVDVALLEPALLGRAVECAGKPAPTLAALAAVALVHGDDRGAAFGRAVAGASAPELLHAAVALLATGQAQVSNTAPGGPPPRGWLALASGLPAAGREQAVEHLLATNRSDERAAGVLIAGLLPTAKTRVRLRDEIKLAPAAFAQLAAAALAEPYDAGDLAALRWRADRAATGDAAERRLAVTLGFALARAGEASDRDRLAAVQRRLRAAGDDARADADALGRAVLLHAARRTPAPATAGVKTAALGDAELGLPLPRLLDGGSWTYARVGQPAALLAAGRAVLGRLRYRDPAEQYLLGALVENLGSGPFSLLGAGGGLDLARPIECAAMAVSGDDFVCTVEVADAAAVDRVLAQRPDAIDGARLPHATALLGIAVGTLAGAGPLLAARALERDDGGDPLGMGDDPARTILRERAVLRHDEAGRQLTRHVVVSATDDGRSTIAGPGLVRVGRRLFVFGSPTVARQVLTGLPAAGTALADDPVFRRAIAGWVDGAAAQALIVPDGEGITEPTVFEVAPDEGGVRFRVASLGGTPSRAMAGAVAMLPPGASASVAHGGSDRGDGDASANAMMASLLGDQRWLFESSGETAYGWYPASGTGPEGWLVITRWQPSWTKTLAGRGLRDVRAGAVRRSGELIASRAGDYLLLGSREDLVTAAAARSPARDERTWVSRLDGPALAAALRTRTVPESRVGILRVMALAAETVGVVEASGRRGAAGDVIEGTLRPPLAGAGEDTTTIDRWLTTPALRNAARLPRPLAGAEVDAPLVFTFEVADARAVAPRLFRANARTAISVVDDRRIRVVVAPGPAIDAAVAAAPLDAAAKSRALAAAGAFRADHPRIREVARRLVPAGTDPTTAARKVGEWVHRTLRYEVTPSGGDAVAILERGRGDCTEYSLLATAILRAAGVPAELRSGIAAGPGELVAHAWLAFHDGHAWREIDPTWGRTSIGADHIDTSVIDFIALVTLDKLTVVAVEPAPRP